MITQKLLEAEWFLKRGFIPLVRGFITHLFFKKSSSLLLIEKSVHILYRRRISLGSRVYFGRYSFINAFCKNGIRIGSKTTIREFAHIQGASSPLNPGEALEIGNSVYIGPRSNIGIGGKISIGSNTLIGADFTAVSENHVFDSHNISKKNVSRIGIEIGEGCWLGHRVTILDGVCLGDGCIVGAGSVVTKSFPKNSRLAGVPAKCL